MAENKNISTLLKEDACCCCSACASICPMDAVSLKYNKQGFLYPEVNQDACINCGLCISVCTALSPQIQKLNKCYAVKRSDEKLMLSSSSGGFAAALTEYILAQGGVVYGVAYSDFPHVATIRVDNIEDAERLKGSKYVQTDPQQSYRKICQDLLSGLTVCYFGTSCHVNGLKSYLDKKKVNMDKLITVDLICHGVPSPRLFEEYIKLISAKKKVIRYDFRTKTFGWGNGSKNFAPTLYYQKNKECDTPRAWGYMRLFFSNNCLRPFCYNCPYAGKGRCGDFTIADYWDVENVFPGFYTKAGVSLVFTNSSEADNVLKDIPNLELLQSEYGKGMERQANLTGPSSKATTYDSFWDEYERRGIAGVSRKYAGLDSKSMIKFNIKRILHKANLWK